MAETVSSLLTALGRRIRDPYNLAHSATSVTGLLSEVQRVVNAMTGAVKITTTNTINNAQPQVFYDMVALFSTHARIERILYQNEEIYQQSWTTFYQDNPFWARASGSRPLYWDTIGRGLLVVTPTVLGGAETISVIGTKVTTALTASSDATEMPDGHMPAILAMAEQLLLMRQRLQASLKPSVEHFERALPTGTP